MLSAEIRVGSRYIIMPEIMKLVATFLLLVLVFFVTIPRETFRTYTLSASRHAVRGCNWLLEGVYYPLQVPDAVMLSPSSPPVALKVAGIGVPLLALASVWWLWDHRRRSIIPTRDILKDYFKSASQMYGWAEVSDYVRGRSLCSQSR